MRTALMEPKRQRSNSADAYAPGGHIIAFEAALERAGTGNDSIHPGELLMTDKEYKLCACCFVMIGTAALYYWNSVLNTLYSVVIVNYPDTPRLADTITALYSTCAFLTALLLSYLGAANIKFNVAGGIVLCLMSIMFPVIVSNVEGKTGEILLYVTSMIAGIAEMFFQVSGFAFSVILPRPFGGWVSFGYGACGVVTFSFWYLLSQGVFRISSDNATAADVRKALWAHFGIGTAVILIAVAAMQYLYRQPLMRAAVERLKETPTVDDAYADPPLTHLQVFKKTWKMQSGLAFLVGLSMMAYPNIGPYQWHRSIKENDLLTGMFQVGDFVGRYIPNASIWVPWLLMPSKYVLPMTVLRVALLVVFILIARSAASGSGGSILTRYGVQVFVMLALSLTNGWYASIFMTRVPEGVDKPRDKAKASAMAVSLLVFAIAVGLWLAKLVHFTASA